MNRTTLPPVLLSLAFSFASGPIAAQILEEVVVTATKRATGLMDTPLAVSAYDSSALDNFGIDNGQDLASRTPSLSITGTPSKISLRGVGRPNNALGSDPGVAIYTDGVYNTEAALMEYNNLFDLERVEVLRGPQGTLYGRNAVGGAIKLVTMGPSPTWRSKVIAELGNYDYQVLQGVMSGPITDQLSMVVSGSTITRDGYQEEVTRGEEFDDRDTQTLRASFKFHWTHNWYSQIQATKVKLDRTPSIGYRPLDFSTDYVQPVTDIDTGAVLNLPGTFPGQNFVNPHQDYPQPNAAVRDESKTQADVTPSEATDTQGAWLLNEVAFGDYRVKYLAAYSEYEYDRYVDNDAINGDLSNFNWDNLFLFGLPVSALTGISQTSPRMTDTIAQQADFTSHDLQLYSELPGNLNFVAGLYYYRSDENQYFAVEEENDDIMAVYQFLGDLVGRNTSDENWLYEGQSQLITTSKAAYGQADWDFTDALSLTAGLRYSQDDKRGGDTTFVQWVGDGYISRDVEDDWDSVDWRLGLNWRPLTGQLFYSTLATGYRSGGFNLMKPTASTDVDEVAPEDLLSFEVGYKGALLDGQLRLSGAAYYYDYQDLQVIRQDVVNGVGVRTFENAEEATAWGLELEAASQLSELISVGGNWSYNRTRYGDFYSKDANACALGPLAQGNSQNPLCTDEQNLEGNTFPLTPEHKLNLYALLNWTWNDIDMQYMLNYMYVGEQYMSPFNLDEYDLVDAWDRWDTQLGLSWDTWTITAWVRNLRDERNWVFRERPGTVSRNLGVSSELTPPRTYGLRLEYQL
ncbi:hypothetical protein BST95_16180 [Halioglobus japonicus]|uniref:TonB-dependent receptor n=1 Tax=Halioglobus japonicus TaxID=930805 RepID=A0AAP8SP68_9GAMM|nr:TonB-dependent receptor [Halioglobus japonicus]AQA19543.1 hypothetical protein BST95_16180 [Halioglobus japonicus]PLW87390.1 TonB-dependent receptor [Halioglobus japonicus]GHD08738.1 TonB-dependent receptor [Halioglobus japonicus]